MRKPSRKGRVKLADQLFSRIVRSRDYCQASGDGVQCGGMYQCAHLEGRRKYALRWDEMNALCLCAGHHRFYSSFPLAWSSFLQERFPEQYAHVIARRNGQWDKDLESVVMRLRARAQELGL
jgi:hypothetical protein